MLKCDLLVLFSNFIFDSSNSFVNKIKVTQIYVACVFQALLCQRLHYEWNLLCTLLNSTEWPDRLKAEFKYQNLHASNCQTECTKQSILNHKTVTGCPATFSLDWTCTVLTTEVAEKQYLWKYFVNIRDQTCDLWICSPRH